MFGYVKVCKPELLIKEYEQYKSIYCGLCRNLGREYGLTARMFLNYDVTFLTLLCIALEDKEQKYENKRCVVNPFKKCNYCLDNQKSYSFTAAVSVFLVYYKLKDNMLDHKGVKKFIYKIALKFFSGNFKKACRNFPDLAKIFNQYFENQNKMELNNKVDIDMSSKPTA
ncbi:MAG: DUF5685 family protein, partial [Clostridia bacterium]|nr:DUF5685 family protein [Clostridia bacterium]